ncbi:MAG TPA: DUF6498-containing protein [Casimicrobiaceae bacterium]|nr:DUF6498-containing protein [Casimicrobiaceae bacterium]
MGFAAALAYALLMNAIPLADVLWHGRSPAALLLLFWFETLLMFVTGAVRIVVHRRATRKTGHYAPTGTVSRHDAGVAEVRQDLGDGNTYLRHFVALTAVFTVAHGLFVLSLVFLFGVGGPLPWADAQAALLWAIAVQVGFLLVDLVHLRAWTFAQLNESCGNATIRVLVTQLGLIFGIPAIGVTGSAWGMIGTFMGLRALADASIAWLRGFVRRRDLPPPLARFLARRGKQTVAELEAEFDAMKERGRDVEVLLERPIDEVRELRPA